MKRILPIFVLFFAYSLIIAQSEGFVARKVANFKSSKQHFAVYNLFTHNKSSKKQAQFQLAAKDAIALDLDKKELVSLVKAKPQGLQLKVPFRNDEITLELVRNDIFNGSGNLRVDTSDGEFKGYEPGVYYQGIIKGDPTSVVALSFFDDDVVGVASDIKVGNIVLGKALDSEDFLIYSDTTLTGANPFVCKVDELMEQQLNGLSFDFANSQKAPKMTDNCVRVYYEIANKPYLQNNSNVTTTTNWITAIHNNIATLYNNDGVKTSIHEIYIWKTTDPYTGEYGQNLEKFRANRPVFNGDLAHLVNYPTTTSVAYLNSLCTGYNHAYSGISMSYSNVPTYSWTIMAMTHEMGHSLGSPHTHACVWNDNNTPIDGCGASAGYTEGCDGPIPAKGTIMSYCHLVGGVGVNLALGFGPQPGALIRNNIDSKACLNTDCVTSCTPTISSMQITNTTSSSISAIFNDPGAATSWRYRLTRADGTLVKSEIVTAKSINIANLEPNTYYFLSINNICGSEKSYQIRQLFLTDANWCGGNYIFTDSGGETGNYSNNETIIKTFTPTNANNKIKLTFTEFDTEENSDVMRIYNGPNNVSPLFLSNGKSTFSGNLNLGSFESTHATGAITFRFSSNGSIVKKGWSANISCKTLQTVDVKTVKFSVTPDIVKGILLVMSTHKVQLLEVFDVNGKLIYSTKDLDRTKSEVTMASWPRGVYIVRANIEGQTIDTKFVK